MRAIWENIVLAESDTTLEVDGYHYFPLESLKKEYFRESEAHTMCSWKGTASYYDIVVNGTVNEDAAWYYSEPKDTAIHIKKYVGFWKGVQVVKS